MYFHEVCVLIQGLSSRFHLISEYAFENEIECENKWGFEQIARLAISGIFEVEQSSQNRTVTFFTYFTLCKVLTPVSET